ncbi:transmembrane protein 72 isoform X1 [Alligator mississippiensis]|uniref:Transmembrane protein 72 n=1 Tax=Alligator mississippiensis TaxID=8496 RepID=A0A151PGP0_ALLMI|nr:transmembrane protein 72 isoform X1 [Alligator mississippiensis]KYO48163.1 transmembrane protein 72 [Alligator mississippiensis]
MEHKGLWKTLEYTCRLLGISTAAVLLGVGAETLQQGRFKSLAFYLLFSGAAVTVCEASFFVSLLLGTCFICQPSSLTHACWKRVRQPGSFQKFLGYVLLSVACFLHPVLIWHVTIPGSMLVLTGLAYFLLSKRQKSPACKKACAQPEQYIDPCATATATTGTTETEQTYTFNEALQNQHTSLFRHMKNILKGGMDGGIAQTAEPTLTLPNILAPHKQVHFQKKVVQIIPSINESLDEEKNEAEETTTDTAPILIPSNTRIFLTPFSTTRLV